MKKFTLVLAAAMLLIAGNSFAQHKPAKGSFGTEVQFNPFDQNGNTFQLDGLKFRYFVTDNDALRLKIGFGLDSYKYKADDSKDDYTKAKTGDFKIDLGYERHFDLAKRLNVYVGGQVGIFKHFASAKAETTNASGKTITETWSNTTGRGNDEDRAYFGFGVGVFTGLDFYVYKGLYVGTELGLNVESRKTCETEHDYDGNSTKSKDSARYTSAGFYIEPVVRLGWTF